MLKRVVDFAVGLRSSEGLRWEWGEVVSDCEFWKKYAVRAGEGRNRPFRHHPLSLRFHRHCLSQPAHVRGESAGHPGQGSLDG